MNNVVDHSKERLKQATMARACFSELVQRLASAPPSTEIEYTPKTTAMITFEVLKNHYACVEAKPLDGVYFKDVMAKLVKWMLWERKTPKKVVDDLVEAYMFSELYALQKTPQPLMMDRIMACILNDGTVGQTYIEPTYHAPFAFFRFMRLERKMDDAGLQVLCAE